MKSHLKSILALLSVTACTAIAPTQAAGPFSRAPYVQLATESSITIVFRTQEAIQPSIRYGTEPDQLDNRSNPSNITLRTKSSATNGAKKLFSSPKNIDSPDNTHQYEITLSGLKPYTTYYYAVFDDGKRLTPRSDSYQFTTHPEIGTEQKTLIWIVGDSGTGGQKQKEVHQAARNFLTKHKIKLDLYLHVGDMAYGSGTDPEFSNRFFDIYASTLRNTVCWPTMGNHEGYTANGKTGVGPYYDAYVTPTNAQAGGVPSGTEAYYSFDYGQTHFICLNSHDLDRSANAAMAQWLKADLDKTKAKWLVAFWHHPPYTKGSHNSDTEHQLIEMREKILPILEAGGVDLTFTGHSHIYERTMLLDKAYDTPTTAENHVLDDGDGDPEGDGAYRKSEGLNPHNGSVHVVAGHGGKLGRRTGSSPVIHTSILEYGSCLMQINGDTLTCKMLNNKGEIRDTFSIKKKGTVTHQPIANPKRPQGFQPPKVADAKGSKMPQNFISVIPRNSEWKLSAGQPLPKNWFQPAFDASAWPLKTAGFGYGDNDDKTILDDMRSRYKLIAIRKTFTPETAAKIALAIRYDDGFIAYINGKEFARVGIENGRGADARGFKNHEARPSHTIFPIPQKLIQPGKENIIAIEGHNANISSSDLTLDPFVIQIK